MGYVRWVGVVCGGRGGGGGNGTILEVSYRVCRRIEECGRRYGFCRNW